MTSPAPDYESMAAFCAVVQAGGFTAAARVLGVSTQGLSDRIARLAALRLPSAVADSLSTRGLIVRR